METSAQRLEYRRVEPVLTKAQRKTLLYNKMLHEHPPTITRLLKNVLPRIYLTLAIFGGVGALGWYLNVAWALPFTCGAAYVVAIFKVRQIQLICGSWPVLDRVMNWDEVDRLLAPPPTTDAKLTDDEVAPKNS